MADSSTKDLVYRIVSTLAGDGFDKASEQAHKTTEELNKLQIKTEELNHLEATIKVKTDAGETTIKLKALEEEARDSGNSAEGAGTGFSGLAAKMSLVAAGAGTIGPALAALPAVLGGAAAAGGVLALGLGGVISALRDYGQAVSSPGISGAQLAATMFANATAVRGAQQAIAQARQSAAWQAASAVDTLTSAEERLSNAEQTAQVATEDLNRARQDEARTLTQLNLSAATAALDVQGAELALAKAKRQQIEIDNSLTATAGDRQDAAFAVAQAENNLINVQERAKEATQDAATANAKGVEGSQQVVAAKRAEAQAQQGVGDAQRALAATQRQIADQQIMSNQAVAKAVQNLADVQKQQQLAMAAQQAGAASGMAAFNREMAKLTPVGQDVVNTIIGMRGGFEGLKRTSENAIGPGVLTFLGGLRTLGPTANGVLAQMGQAIGTIFAGFGTMMQNPIFQGQLTQVFRDGAQFVSAFGQGFVSMVQGLTAAASTAGPIVQGLGGGLKTLMGSGIPAFFAGLASNASGAGSTLNSILSAVSGLLGPLGKFAGIMGGALAPAFKILAPVLSDVANQVLSALLPYMPQLGDAFAAIAQAVAQIAPVLAPLVGMLAGDFVQTLQIVVPLVGDLAGFIHDNQTWLVPLIGAFVIAVSTFKTLAAIVAVVNGLFEAFDAILLANPIGLIIAAIAGLVAGLVYAWNHFSGFRDFIKQTWSDIKQWFGDAVGWVEDRWHSFTGLFDPSKWGDGVHHMWDWIKDSFKWAINVVIGWWDDLNFTLPSVHIPGLGDVGGGTIGLPQIPKLAGGGTAVAPGLAWVGENGPELIRMASGAQVIPNPQSMALAGGHGPSLDGFTATIIMRSQSGEEIDRQLVAFQRQGGVSQAIQVGALAALGTGAR